MDVVLRGFSRRDDDALQALMDDTEVRQWNPMKGETAAGWRALRDQDDAATLTWGVAAAADDRLLGTMSLGDIDHAQGTCEVGYRILAVERGHGVATAALDLASTHVFDELGLRRIQLFHALRNPASCVVAERAGFALEGTLRDGYVYGDGAAYDEHLHGRLRADPVGRS